jgi:hypothetical protein
MWAGGPLQLLDRATADLELGLELGDPLVRLRQLFLSRRCSPRLQATVDAVLTAPVTDRLVRQVEVVCHRGDTSTLLEQIEDLASELC